MSPAYEATLELTIEAKEWGSALQEAEKLRRRATSSDEMSGVDLSDAEVTEMTLVDADE